MVISLSLLVDADFIRSVVDILSTEASDSVLEVHSNRAQEMVLKDISSYRTHEEMTDLNGFTPNKDGSNKKFYVRNVPVADTDFDLTVDGDDLTVYEWSNEDDETTASVVSVTSVNADTGLVQLTTAPASSIQKVTCSYRFHLSQVNNTILQIATAILAGLLWIQKDRILMPDRVSVGAYKWQYTSPAYKKLYEQYLRTINFIKTNKAQRRVVKNKLPWNDPKLVSLYYAEIGGLYS